MMLKIAMAGNLGCHCCHYHMVIPQMNLDVANNDWAKVHL